VNFKKNLFWIIMALVVLAGVVLWFMYVPPIEANTDEVMGKCKSRAEHFEELAAGAGKENVVKTSKHVELAEKFGKKLDEQLKGLTEELKSFKLDMRRFEQPPVQNSQFDIWLSELRQRITKHAADAGLQLPPDAEKLMFNNPATDDNSHLIELHRGFRLRQMAIIQEIVDILSNKYGKQQVLKFEPHVGNKEPEETADVGALALEKVSFAWPKDQLAPGRAADEKGLSASESRTRVVMEEALRRAGVGGRGESGGARPVVAAKAAPVTYTELPYSITCVDIQFVAPLAIVPAIADALEASNRWTAVISRIEYERSSVPYPSPTEPRLVKAGPVPGLNTHYQEAPVRALVSLELYEYDEAKAKAAAAPPPVAVKTAAKKEPKPAPEPRPKEE
jgi:hypothetical protein